MKPEMNADNSSIIGVSCLVWWRDTLVLEVQKPHKWRIDDRREVHIGLGCVGGTLNEGETAIEALQREAVEEMGCPIELCDALVTYAVTPECQVHEETWLTPGPRPLFLWEACLPGLIPGKRVVVFRGRPMGEPTPVDLPALLCVTPEILRVIGRAGIRLGEAQKLGASLQARITVPDTVWLELVGTPAVLHLLHTRKEPVAGVLIEPM